MGDVFLFFGWFAGEGQTDHHRIFGYLAVEQIIRLATISDEERRHFAAISHPHAFGFHHAKQNDTLYVGRGAAATHASEALRLTREGMSRTQWRVPKWLRGVGLTYHRDPKRWSTPGHLATVAQGQEFVADIVDRNEPRAWLDGIIAEINRS